MIILIVDDHPLVCRGIRNILLTEKDIDDVMEANDIQSALMMMTEYEFSLALVDIRLKNESGIDFIKIAKKNYPRCKYVILSSSSAAKDFDMAMEMDVDGYILKDALPEDIIYAVKSILRGKKYFDSVFMKKRIFFDPVDQLSPREKEILECIAEGFSNKVIAEKLYISENTVKKHVSNILSKLNLEDRLQAALYFNKSSDND